jgi:mitogen-activated protein kinase kinase kinase
LSAGIQKFWRVFDLVVGDCNGSHGKKRSPWSKYILTSFRTLTQRFSNSAEYSLDDIPLDEFITLLVSSDHFLVYTNFLEEEGIYIVASSSLYGQTELIRKILDDAFQVSEVVGEDGAHVLDNLDTSNPDSEAPGYVLVLSPQTHFLWSGRPCPSHC